MAKTRQQKKEMIELINQHLDQSKAFIVSAFDNISVNDDQQLRSNLRKENVNHNVVKKTLLTRSFEEKKIDKLPTEDLLGNITITSSKDEVSGAKILNDFAKDHEGFNILGGLLNQVWVSADKIKELAKLPSKPELIAKTVGTIKAPLTGMVNILSGNLRNLVGVLENIKKQKNN